MSLGAPSRELELAAALIALRRQWGHCYRIWHEDGTWIAQRRDDHSQVTGDDTQLLRDAIADDHATRPVPPQHRLPEAPLAAARGHAPHTAPVSRPAPGSTHVQRRRASRV